MEGHFSRDAQELLECCKGILSHVEIATDDLGDLTEAVGMSRVLDIKNMNVWEKDLDNIRYSVETFIAGVQKKPLITRKQRISLLLLTQDCARLCLDMDKLESFIVQPFWCHCALIFGVMETMADQDDNLALKKLKMHASILKARIIWIVERMTHKHEK